MPLCDPDNGFEISPRFRATIENRIARLEQDADSDEAQLEQIVDSDHRRRQIRLVAVQGAEAARMRVFLDRARVRLPRSVIAL